MALMNSNFWNDVFGKQLVDELSKPKDSLSDLLSEIVKAKPFCNLCKKTIPTVEIGQNKDWMSYDVTLQCHDESQCIRFPYFEVLNAKNVPELIKAKFGKSFFRSSDKVLKDINNYLSANRSLYYPHCRRCDRQVDEIMVSGSRMLIRCHSAFTVEYFPTDKSQDEIYKFLESFKKRQFFQPPVSTVSNMTQVSTTAAWFSSISLGDPVLTIASSNCNPFAFGPAVIPMPKPKPQPKAPPKLAPILPTTNVKRAITFDD